jgi:hypothetical protein
MFRRVSMLLLIGSVIIFSMVVFPAAAIEMHRIKTKGTISGIAPLKIAVKLDDGRQLIASLNPKRVVGKTVIKGIPEPQVEFSGTGSLKDLQRGMFVRTKLKLNGEPRPTTKQQMTELTVFAADHTTQFGYISSGLGVPDPANPGAVAAEGKYTGPGEYTVVGQVLNAKAGKIVKIGFPNKTTLDIPIGNDLTVHVVANDLRLARIGDSISLKGFYEKLPNVFATEVKIRRVAAAKPPAIAKDPKPNPPPGVAKAPKPGEVPEGAETKDPPDEPVESADGSDQAPSGEPVVADKKPARRQKLKVN